jgi:hypothetical protein
MDFYEKKVERNLQNHDLDGEIRETSRTGSGWVRARTEAGSERGEVFTKNFVEYLKSLSDLVFI